ncbi:endonuclease/exonuclease/phosphatase family protein [Tumidithrix elongata RA019]|uniref:Endonuclease/exonuclease/phosphatase family protein n=1 Tax=Tumidithrix elongata BACA0141 TaxID=2716417 RepID=A0AAW9PXL1_9CYAN|nr:endonuclease/exonuclease/phosphatase family protein [Tumidithrix elongata RA019]
MSLRLRFPSEGSPHHQIFQHGLSFLVGLCLSMLCMTACSSSAPSQIRIGTYNVENFDGQEGAKVETLAKIVDRNFDAIGLQEVSAIAAEKLKTALNKSHHWEFLLGESGNKQRIALFYRSDLITANKVTEWNRVNVTGTLRSPLVAYLKVGNGFNFTMVVVHQKGSGEQGADEIRRQQSDVMRAEVDAYERNTQSDPDLVVLGDFNSPTWAAQNRGFKDGPLLFLTRSLETDATYNCLKRHGTPTDANGRPRFTNKGTGCVIDHIAVSKGTKGAEAEYLPQSIQILDPVKDLGFASDRDYFQKVSDHLPVRAIFRSDKNDD